MKTTEKTAIIIGGGTGGLFCGAILSKEGWRVKVFERHSIVGGGLHQFARHGVRFETGMHVAGAFHPNAVLHCICSYLGVMDKLAVLPADNDCFDLFHVQTDGRKYAMPRGFARFTTALCSYFPQETDNIRRYMHALYAICDEVSLYNLRFPGDRFQEFSDRFMQSVGAFIDSFTTDERLRHVLAYGNPLYAGDRYVTPVYIHALISKFYIEGACRFVGGSQQLADALAEVIRQAGGQIYLKNGVKRIAVENKQVTGIEADDGSLHQAGRYISTIHPAAFFDLVDPARIQRSYRTRITSIPNTYSAYVVFISFLPNTFPFFNYTYYYQDDYADTWQHHLYDADTWPKGLMCTTPPANGHDTFAEKMIVNCIMEFSVVRQWEQTRTGRRGADYESFKRCCEEKVIAKLERIFPDIRRCIRHVYSASPLTIRDYYNQKDGAMYGVKKDCRNMALSHIAVRTKLENLFFSGQNINLHGILGVPLTAINTCAELVGMQHLLDKITAYRHDDE